MSTRRKTLHPAASTCCSPVAHACQQVFALSPGFPFGPPCPFFLLPWLWAPFTFPTQASPIHYPSGEEPYQDELCIFLRILVAQEGWGMDLGPLPSHTIPHGRFCPTP